MVNNVEFVEINVYEEDYKIFAKILNPNNSIMLRRGLNNCISNVNKEPENYFQQIKEFFSNGIFH